MRKYLDALGSIFLLLVGTLMLWAAGELILAIRDPALSGPEPPRQAWRWHRALTPAVHTWARERTSSGVASELSIADISGTEWPMFGAVFYLRATENLDNAWSLGVGGERPAVYARDAIDAAAELLVDPAHSHWVRQHWGEAYLDRENVFYRMLLIDGLSAQTRLVGSTPHLTLLREQVTGLAEELSRSRDGLLADYPGQTFPADVAAAWHAILRADPVLGTDHRKIAGEGIRGFVDAMAPSGHLPPYAWFDEVDPAPTKVRGSANAWLLHHAPFIWPTQAHDWFAAHTSNHWQESWWMAGYREFDRNEPEGGAADVDSGPIVDGLGVAATAFGIGAARSVGAGVEARAMALEGIALSWPLPTGRLLVPRLLSDLAHAPLLGESALIYNLTQPTAPGFRNSPASTGMQSIPGLVWLILGSQLVIGAFCLWVGIRRGMRIIRPRRR